MGTYVIDTQRTFSAILLAASSPKLRFGTSEHDHTAAGLPKWQLVATVIYATEDGQPTPAPEVITVTIASQQDPAAGIAPGTPIQLDGFRLGVSTPEAREGGRVRGGRPWYQATAVRSLISRKSDAA